MDNNLRDENKRKLEETQNDNSTDYDNNNDSRQKKKSKLQKSIADELSKYNKQFKKKWLCLRRN